MHASLSDPTAALRRRILRDLDAPRLAAAIHDAVLRSVPAYAKMPPGDREHVLAHCSDHGAATYETLRDGTAPSHERLAFVRDTASLRARQNVPLSLLLHAYRAGYMAVWDAVRGAIGAPATGADMDALMLGSELAMEYFNAISTEATRAYLSERERIATSLRVTQESLVHRLLAGELEHTDETVPQLSAFALDRRRGCRVLLLSRVDGAPLGPDTLEALIEVLRRESGPPLAAIVHGRVVVVLPDNPLLATAAEHALSRLPDHERPAIVAGLGLGHDRLHEAPQAYVEAQLALRIASPSRPFVDLSRTGLFDAMLAEAEPTVRRLLPGWSQALLDDDARVELLSTLEAYLDSELNVGRAAKRLGVHPNTVRYRLQRIETIAGGSTRDFHDLVEIHTVVRLLPR